MSRWFRLYDEVLDDPKVQRLPDRLFKTWVNLLCAASRNDGIVPCVADLAFLLRRDETKLAGDLDALMAVGLLDEIEGAVTPHNWNGRQFQSDKSTERVKRYRNGQRNVTPTVSETASETPPDTETDTEPETETESKREAREARVIPKTVLLAVLDEERATAVVEHRQRIRAPLTGHAAKLLAGKFAQTDDPNAAADAMVANGWRGFDPSWLQPNSRAPPRVNGGRPNNLEIMRDILKEADEKRDGQQRLTGKPGEGDGRIGPPVLGISDSRREC